MAMMNVLLTDEHETFLSTSVEKGHYSDASEAVRAGLQLLEQQEADERAEAEWLLAEAQVGIDAMERGDFVTLNSAEEIREHFRGLLAEIEASSS